VLLELRDVVAGYLKNVDVLQGINLSVDLGEIVCLIGPNGAGKSTVLRVVSGLLTPSAGVVVFDGQDISGVRPDLVLQHGIAHVPQGHSSFPEMSVLENLLMGAYTVGDRDVRDRRLQAVFELFPWFKERSKQRAGNLSGGQQKLLEIGRALMLEPRMMLLDEPSLGLDPKKSHTVFDTIGRLREETGITVLMVEQNARSGLRISDRGYVLELGKERLERRASELLDDPKVGQLYLGGSINDSPGQA